MRKPSILPVSAARLPALPARFRQPRVLVVGCGDVGLRVLPRLRGVRVLALTSSPARLAELRAAGAVPLVGNLDQRRSLKRLKGLAQRVIHLAPPPGSGSSRDPRTRALLQALARGGGRSQPRQLVYGSTTGVYGDCGGDWVSEARPCRPATERARRRVDAESTLRQRARRGGIPVSILRIPGIYAPERSLASLRERLLRGQPVLQASDDVYTNHIHAEDLARAVVLALWRGRAQRVYHISDNTELRMGDYYDAVADVLGLPRPPRVSRAEASARLGAMQMSFMSESRRLLNLRLAQELRLKLRYPDVWAGWAVAKT